MIKFNNLAKKLLLASVILLTSCSTMESNQTAQDASLLETYDRLLQSIRESERFEDVVEGYYLPELKGGILNSYGWKRFAYSAVYKALKNGKCHRVDVYLRGERSAILECEGEYRFRSPILGISLEQMVLQVYFVKANEKWYISKSGFQHTHLKEYSNKLKSYGIKIIDDLEQDSNGYHRVGF